MDAVERVETWLDHGETGYGGTIPTDAIRTLLSLARSNGWQDIATAPKDGTKFLAFTEDGVVCEMYAATDGASGAFMFWEGLYSDGLTCRAERSVGGPTHWQPLPEPPLDRLRGSEDV